MNTTTPVEILPMQTPKSRTLLRLEKSPETVCAVCPNALWHTVKKQTRTGLTVRVYCKLMHVLVDELLADCDGIPDDEPESSEVKDYTEYDKKVAARNQIIDERNKRLDAELEARPAAAAPLQAGLSEWGLPIMSDDDL